LKILLAPEAATLLRVTPNRVYELAKRGVITCVRVGRQVRFCEEHLLEWIANGGSPLSDDKASFFAIPNVPASSTRR
jgi:excisionase family DNA binding protein